MTYAQAMLLAQAKIDRLDAQILLALVTGKDQQFFYAYPETKLSATECEKFQELLQQRYSGKPIAYILGQQDFWKHTFAVNKHTLIPRPETELIIEWCLENLSKSKPLRFLDLGTGSGAIAISLALEFENSHVIATDKSAPALSLAQKNAASLGAQNIEFVEGNWFEPVVGLYDVIISNPPYINVDDQHLSQGDLRFEPKSALVSDKNGLADLEKIIQQAAKYLKDPGVLLLEHGYDQAQAVMAMLKCSEFSGIVSHQDYGKNNRMVVASYGNSFSIK